MPMSRVYLGTRHRNGSQFLSFPSATFGHFRQKQPSLHWNFSVHHPVIQEQSNNHFKNVACDSCEEEFASSGGKCCVPSILLMSLLMGLGEAECAACHFKIKGPRCWFPKPVMKSLPSLSLASPGGLVSGGAGSPPRLGLLQRRAPQGAVS